MTTLSDNQIIARLQKDLVIKPLNENQFNRNHIQPGSIDLTLWTKLEVIKKSGLIDIENVSNKNIDDYIEQIDINDGYNLKPGETVTGYSAEYIEMPLNLNGAIFNRNSYAMIGIDAGISQYINPGFKGHKIIVIHNSSPNIVRLVPGIRICQLVLFSMGSNSTRSYEERHDIRAFGDSFDLAEEIKKADSNKDLDNPLSDFMNKRIKQISEAMINEF